jgi:hypothetical protein
MNSPSFSTSRWWPTPISSTSMSSCHYQFISTLRQTFPITLDVGQTNLLAISHSQSFQAVSSTDLHACLHLGDTFFCKGRKVMETNLKRSCLGALYMANSNSIQNHCRFKIAEAQEKIYRKTPGPSTQSAQSAPI